MSAQLLIIGVQLAALIYIAIIDIATRLISNKIVLLVAGLGVGSQLLSNIHQLPASFLAATILFLLLLFVYQRGWMGGGDIKLLAALTIGLPIIQLIPLFMTISLAGGILGVIHLMLRYLPKPVRSPVGASCLRRVYAVERWRNIRRGPLPYGVAIACGAIWIILSSHGA